MAKSKPGLVKPEPNCEVRLFVCEDIRSEVNGKMSLIGLFADDVIIVPRLPDDEHHAVKSLAFMFTFMNVREEEGPLRVKIDWAADGETRPFMAEREIQNPGQGRSANLLGTIAPFVFKKFGHREFIVSVNDQVHRKSFELRAREMTAEALAELQAAKGPAATEKARATAKKSRVSGRRK